MAKYLTIIILIVFSSCSFEEEHLTKQFSIKEEELLYKKGNVLSIEISPAITGVGFIADIAKDEGGIWYGICFTNYADSVTIDTAKIKYLSVYGRKIASSIDSRGYIKAMDVCFLNDSTARSLPEKITVISNLHLHSNSYVGANASARKFEELVNFYNNGRQQRLQLPDDYRNHYKEDFRADQYLPLQDFAEPELMH